MKKLTFAKLRGRMAETGFTKKMLAVELGITVQAFNNKLNGTSDWKLNEIKIILNVLNSTFNDLFSE